MPEPFDISDVSFVKRIVIGNTNPEKLLDNSVMEKQMAFLNRCLSEYPRGKIIGQEKGFNILRIGEHQIVMQYVVYHVGFKRKPHWMDDYSSVKDETDLFDFKKLSNDFLD